jgi:hypothetical protein
MKASSPRRIRLLLLLPPPCLDVGSRRVSLQCRSCRRPFDIVFQQHHHCRLCGQVFCHDCSSTRSLIPPSVLVLLDVVDGWGRFGGVVGGRNGPAASFSPAHRDDDGGGACDASVTYVGPLSAAAPLHSSLTSARRRDYGDGNDAVLHRGRNLEGRVLLARHPQRTPSAGCATAPWRSRSVTR